MGHDSREWRGARAFEWFRPDARTGRRDARRDRDRRDACPTAARLGRVYFGRWDEGRGNDGCRMPDDGKALILVGVAGFAQKMAFFSVGGASPCVLVTFTSHPLYTTLRPLNSTHHPLYTTHRPLNATCHPLNTTRHPLHTTLHPLNTTRHPLYTPRHPLNATRHPLYTTRNPLNLRRR